MPQSVKIFPELIKLLSVFRQLLRIKSGLIKHQTHSKQKNKASSDFLALLLENMYIFTSISKSKRRCFSLSLDEGHMAYKVQIRS